METQLKFSQQPAQIASKQETETDPFAEYEEQFEKDPKEAIKGLIAKTKAKADSDAMNQLLAEDRKAAQQYYLQQKTDNPDFAKLEPTIQQLAAEYNDLVRPDKPVSAKAIKLLHLAALGARQAEFLSEAATKAKKESTTIREEKRSAFTESAGSKGAGTKNFSDLSVDEMEKALGISRG